MTSKKTVEKRKRIKKHLLLVLQEHIWPILSKEGFSWRKNSLKFRRESKESIQILNYDFNLPIYRNDPVEAYIEPWITIYMPGISKHVVELLEDTMLIGDSDPGMIFNFSVGMVGPKRSGHCWEFTHEKKLSEIGHSMAEFTSEFVVPFLNRYQSTADVVEGLNSGDDRLDLPISYWIKLTATYLDNGKVDEAKEFLYSKIDGKVGLMKRFKKAIEYFERRT